MIRSKDNDKLKTVRKLQQKRWRDRLDMFAAEGEDLVEAAELAGWEPETLLVAGQDVEEELLDEVSVLGSGTRAIGIYKRRWSSPGGDLSLYLHGVGDPGNVGNVIRAAHAMCDGPVVLGPRCADPYSPKAVRASMGSIFARPPAHAGFEELDGTLIALDPDAELTLDELEAAPPVVVCVGAEREGLPDEVLDAAGAVARRIPLRHDGPRSLNAAVAAAVALYELGTRMAADA